MPRTTSSPRASRALAHHFAVGADALARLEAVAVVLAGGEEADRGPAGSGEGLGLLDHLRAGGGPGRGEGRDAVALLAAEELVDRYAERLALDVVERDVDGRDRRGEHPAAFEILAAVHLLPERADREGVAADEESARSAATAPATAFSRPERPPSPQPKTPSSVSTLTRSWLRVPTQAAKGVTAVIFMGDRLLGQAADQPWFRSRMRLVAEKAGAGFQMCAGHVLVQGQAVAGTVVERDVALDDGRLAFDQVAPPGRRRGRDIR